MIYRTIQPSIKLKDYVRFYWFLESEQPYTHHAMADVCPELIFHFKGRFNEVLENGKRELSFISGISAPTRQIRKFEINSGFGIFGIYLYPHAIPLLFGIPANAVTNQMVELDALGRTFAVDLEDEVMNGTTNQKRIAIIESFIEKRLSKNQTVQLPVFEALKHIMKTPVAPKVGQLSSDYFVSERQLERQFLRFTGFNPKQFIRITRFHRAMQFYGRQEMSLTDIALDCGYYDQSHFINDFKQFSGIGPREFFSGKSPATVWRD
ncbi:MAG: AraC family transcriptional regulator [Cyclobacteriaceae bacterium]|nr:AraC family transcriptional regulator [Cyclobacteriaceae bacterium]